jgi:hypothetical protein
MKGESEVVMGWRYKLQSTAARVLPADMTAELDRGKVGPSAAKVQRGGHVAAIGMIMGGLAAAALATWYGLGRRRPLAPWLVHRPAPPTHAVPHDRSGWGRAG